MTNEEAISKLDGKKELLDRNGFINLDEFDIAINSIQENAKLKAENEQLKENYDALAKQYSNVENSSIRYYNELKQLKSELEQSVKLPCKLGNIVYKEIIQHDSYNDSEYKIISAVCFRLDMLDKIGKSVFLTREEAEQSLKNKINDKQLEAIIEADNVKKDFKEFCDKRDKEEGKLKFMDVE